MLNSTLSIELNTVIEIMETNLYCKLKSESENPIKGIRTKDS